MRRIVVARSAAPMPLPAVTWSIDTVNGVSLPARSDGTIGHMSSSSSRFESHGMHTSPRAHRNMKLIASPRDPARRHREVALVLAVFVVDDEDHLAAPDALQGFVDGRE